MLPLLQWIFVGHVHKWETKDVLNGYCKNDELVARVYHCRCERCGEWRRFTL